MYLAIVFLPLISAICGGIFGQKMGPKITSIFTTTCIFITAILSWIAFYKIAIQGKTFYIQLFTWMEVELFEISWGFQFDSLTVVMLVVVNTVSALVHLYSISYMSHDPNRPRFMAYLSLFTFFMLMLVTSDNFVQLFLGWEGVGLSSYLLINFWYTRIQANKAAVKAMIVNRVGDFGLGLGILAIFFTFKCVDFSSVFSLAPYFATKSIYFLNYEFNVITVICILLFIGAIGKSAQIGLHTWLPDAMEGPTPVSALIHAATMVTAGVFLIVRCSPLFEYSSTALSIVAIIGAITAFFAATTGLVQNDLKRVIAYSTCSQLGYMVFACGISNYAASMYHLANHAFFKALLFLSAGSIIHALGDEQDMRKMGGIVKFLPFTYSMMLIGSMSLMGFPFLTGFYSKDAILELAYGKYEITASFGHWLGCISAFFTAFYSFRLIYLTFFQKTNINKSIFEHIHDSPIIMGIPLIILSFGSIFIGYFWKDMMLGLGTPFWGSAIFTHPKHLSVIEGEFMPTFIKLTPVLLSISGAIFAIITYHIYQNIIYKNLIKYNIIREIFIFLNKKWFFDKIYNLYIIQNILSFGYKISYKILDKGFIEIVGPYGIFLLLKKWVKKIVLLQSGYIYHYAFIMLVGLIGFMTYFGLQNLFGLDITSNMYIIWIITLFFYTYYCINNDNNKNQDIIKKK
jgi:proton-translocating NADH-quinone oxidoreductase chain L